MDKKFLDKVLDQIVSETKIDYDQGIIHFPFPLHFSVPSLSSFLFSPLFFPPFLSLPFFPRFFFKHCRDVYGLNNEESKYVWEEYKQIIIDIIKNNG